MIPRHGWKPMETAPKDGTIFIAVSHEWNSPTAALQVQPCQWLCNMKGQEWGWYLPARPGAKVYADGWLTFEEFQKLQDMSKSTPQYDDLPSLGAAAEIQLAAQPPQTEVVFDL